MKRKNKQQSLNMLMVCVLFFATSTIALFHLLNSQRSHNPDVETLEDSDLSTRFWVLCESCEKNDANNLSNAAEFHRLEQDLSKDRSMMAKYPKLRTFINEPGINTATVSTLLQAVVHGRTWIFATKRLLDPHNVIHISEIANNSKQYGMVYSSPGIFEPCRHFVDANDEVSVQDIKGKNSDYYIVRRISPSSIRVLPDSEACSPFEKSPPVVIMPGTYAAISLQEVFLHRDLFWMSIIHLLNALEQPSVWHLSIFLQRLLWETEHQLIIIGPSYGSGPMTPKWNRSVGNPQCQQHYEAHEWDAVKDFAHELSDLTCTYEHFSFVQCALELLNSDFSATCNRFERLKRTLNLWFTLLDYISYDFPIRVPFTRNKLMQKRWGIPAMFSPPKLKPYYHLHTCHPVVATDDDIQGGLYSKDKEILENSQYDDKVEEINMRQKRGRIDANVNENNETDLLDLLNAEKETDDENEFTSLCRSVNTVYKPVIPERFKFDDILLIVVFNYP
ncbi:hypothetical protein ElyMa_006099400 [Elysia marginata]|uniref:Glycosyltransferase family 92 protein n=1 Tax=Elysia marginata TaxID=1093978 RepID=A0AAV4GRB3_9GAST|nr:hypothetical protein ElyMa_006099400 [Elysia marginata]